MNPSLERLLATLRGWFANDADKLKVVTDAESELKTAAADTDTKGASASAQVQKVDMTGLPADVIALIQGMTDSNTKLTREVEALNNREKERDQAAQARAATEHKAKIETAIQKAITDRRLAPKDDARIASWREVLAKDFENGIKVLETLPPTIKESAGATVQTQGTAQTQPVADRATLFANARAVFAEQK